MKALIVDDERHVREGIKILADWEQNGIQEIYEAGNGEEAIQLIQTIRPEIIFSDMKMPKMDGTQLLEWIKENQPDSKTIVVTGYDDYHYMRKAIRFGSSDYLLKPIEPEILNQTLEKAVNEWKKEEVDRKRKETSSLLINEMKPVYRDRKLTHIMNSDSIQDELYEEFAWLQQSRQYILALVPVEGKTIEAFQGDRDLAYFSILNVINEILMEYECGIGFRYLSKKGQIIIIFWDMFEQIENFLIRMYRTLKNVMDISCPIAVGKPVDSSTKLIDSYHYARQVLLKRNILIESESRVFIYEIQSPPIVKDLMSYAPSIELAVKTGEMGAFEELIHQINQDFTEKNYLSPRQLLNFENEYMVISNKWFKYYNIPLKVPEDIEERVDLFFDSNGTFQLEEYKKRIKREIAIFLKKVKKSILQKNNIIADIEKYLQENFDRDVKLQEISEHFYISREYISRKFKQEFNENISDYIVRIRMGKAKSLLKNSQLKIYEIASMIGYQDDKYFRKVFKKVEGMTPNEYRAKYVMQ
jgi:two-component system, response regulator YesN